MKALLAAAAIVLSGCAYPQGVSGYGVVNVEPGVSVEFYNSQPAVVNYGYSTSPLYVYVPLEHRQDWRRYCNLYYGCDRPTYFVSDSWYHNHYRSQPRYYSPPPVRHYEPPRQYYRPAPPPQHVMPPRDFNHDGRPDHRGPGRDHDHNRDGRPDHGRGR